MSQNDAGSSEWGDSTVIESSAHNSRGNWYSRRRRRKKRRLAAMSRKRRVWRRVGLTSTWLLAILAALLVVTTAVFYQLSRVPQPTDLKTDQVATITYADGSVMARIGDTNRTIVPLSKVPVDVRWDVLAAEDRGFYSEPGISLRGTARAAWKDLTGGDAQGGSGITQQYVKNVYTNSDRTLTRKLRELAIALKLDREYTKNQILEWYLNTIYFGRGAYGIQAAAQAYFGVDVDKLNVNQGAVLAGLIQSPSAYDPTTALQLATNRWNYVLDGMVTIKKLDAATRATLKFPAVKEPRANPLGATGPEALIVAHVKAELEADGINEAELNTGGLTIRTTIDRTAQNDAETAIKQVYSDLSAQQVADKLREAMVAVDPATGGVLAYYGGSNGIGFDYAQGWRPPGSSFKPFTLAAVLDANLAGKQPAYAINSIIDGSQPYDVEGLKIVNDPGDNSASYPQPITQAMKVSLNTAFARLANAVGPAAVATAAHTAGIPKVKTDSAGRAAGQKTLVDSSGNTSVTIGYGSYPVRPIDQAAAMATFAAGGVQRPAHFIQKVTDATGKTLFTTKTSGTQAFDPRVANDVTVSMNQVAAWSNDPLADGRPSAAKTGTVGIDCPVNYPSYNGCNSDAWMVGFTPQVSVAVWTGNDQSGVPVLNRSGGPLYGSNMPGQAWQTFMDLYLNGKPQLPVATQQEIFNGTNQTTSPSPTSSPTPTTVAPSTSAVPTPTRSANPTPTPTPTRSATPTPTVTTKTVPAPTKSTVSVSSPAPPRIPTKVPGVPVPGVPVPGVPVPGG